MAQPYFTNQPVPIQQVSPELLMAPGRAMGRAFEKLGQSVGAAMERKYQKDEEKRKKDEAVQYLLKSGLIEDESEAKAAVATPDVYKNIKASILAEQKFEETKILNDALELQRKASAIASGASAKKDMAEILKMQREQQLEANFNAALAGGTQTTPVQQAILQQAQPQQQLLPYQGQVEEPALSVQDQLPVAQTQMFDPNQLQQLVTPQTQSVTVQDAIMPEGIVSVAPKAEEQKVDTQIPAVTEADERAIQATDVEIPYYDESGQKLRVGTYDEIKATLAFPQTIGEKIKELNQSKFPLPSDLTKRLKAMGYQSATEQAETIKKIQDAEKAELGATAMSGEERKFLAGIGAARDSLDSMTDAYIAATTIADPNNPEFLEGATGAFKGLFRNLMAAVGRDDPAKMLQSSQIASITQFAKGVFGETGVLTNEDVDRYTKTLPSLKTSENVAFYIMYDLKMKMNSQLVERVKSMKAGNVPTRKIKYMYNIDESRKELNQWQKMTAKQKIEFAKEKGKEIRAKTPIKNWGDGFVNHPDVDADKKAQTKTPKKEKDQPKKSRFRVIRQKQQ